MIVNRDRRESEWTAQRDPSDAELASRCRVRKQSCPSKFTIWLSRSVHQEYLWTLNFGPQHPATHTTLRLVLTLDGETVVKAVPDIGYLHCGFEKLGEDLDFNQYVTIVDRMNYISPLANEIAWHHAVEKLLGIELTPRCKYLRTILAELMRMHDHLLCVGTTRPGPGRLHGVPVRVSPAGADLRHRRVGLGPAVPHQLHARRRAAVRRERRVG